MKKLTKAMLATGGALLLGAGAVANYLMSQQPQTAQEELTLANLEAMAFIDPDDPDNPDLDLDNGEQSYVICYSESRVKIGYTYYDCGKCPQKTYDEQGKGQYSKCFF